MSANWKLNGALTGLTVATVAMAVLTMAGSAVASRRIVTPSKISIKSAELRFGGHVSTSSYPSCDEDRKVVLYKAVGHGPAEPVASTTTNEKGAWSVKLSGFAGISLTPFFAKVKASSQGAAGTIYACAAAKSKTIKPGS